MLGIGGGVGAGLFLAPPPEPEEIAASDGAAPSEADEEPADPVVTGVEYINLSSQFIVPLLVDGKVDAIIVLAIGLEVVEGSMQTVLSSEPKIRAAFLQSLFNHANNGGFSGNFTAFSAMETLRRELVQVSKAIAGKSVNDVLILDVVRQDP